MGLCQQLGHSPKRFGSPRIVFFRIESHAGDDDVGKVVFQVFLPAYCGFCKEEVKEWGKVLDGDETFIVYHRAYGGKCPPAEREKNEIVETGEPRYFSRYFPDFSAPGGSYADSAGSATGSAEHTVFLPIKTRCALCGKEWVPPTGGCAWSW